MTKIRSRNYPSLNLGEAIERARLLYKKEGRATTTADVAVQAWGYNSLNGASLRTLSALRQYGLAEGSNESFRLSSSALTLLLEPSSSSDYREALETALVAPAVFGEVLAEYGEDTLPSDGTLVSYLVRKKGFSEGAAKTLIAALRDSLQLVRSNEASYISSQPSYIAPTNQPSMPEHKLLPASDIDDQGDPWSMSFTHVLSGDTVARLTIGGAAPSQDDVDDLSSWLDLVKRSIAKKAARSAEPAQGE